MKALVMLLALVATTASAADTTLAGWLASLKKDPRLKTPTFVVLQPAKDGYAIRAIPGPDAFEGATGLTLRTAAEADWHHKLNAKDGVLKLNGKLPDVIAQLGADLAVFMPANAPWQIVTRSGQDAVPAPTSAPKNGTEWGAWLNAALGYDGVILAREGEYVLVRGTPSRLARGKYGLVIAGSDATLRLDSAKRQGAAMMRQIESDGAFGLFKLEMQSGKDFPPQTKILLQ